MPANIEKNVAALKNVGRKVLNLSTLATAHPNRWPSDMLAEVRAGEDERLARQTSREVIKSIRWERALGYVVR